MESFEQIAMQYRKSPSKSTARVSTKLLSFGITKSAARQGQREQVSFHISPTLAKSARILPGDRVALEFDRKTRTGKLRRVLDGSGGYAVSGQNADAKEFGPCQIKASFYPGLPRIDGLRAECSKVTVTHDGISFVFPDAAIFTDKVPA